MKGADERIDVARKWIRQVVVVVAIGTIGFHLWRAQVGILDALLQRPIHLMGMLIVALLGNENSLKTWKHLISYIVLAALGVGACIHLVLIYQDIVGRAAAPTLSDVLFGVALVVVVLEATRKTIGWTLPVLSLLFLAYLFFGPYMPGLFAHRGYGVARLASTMYLGTLGIWTVPLGVCANFIVLFVLFGAILEVSGGGDLVIRFANALTGASRGGPAKTAVIASSMFGTISGSSPANTATTGNFTIPLMKRMGLSPDYAAAVEAAASTNGQIIPPVMGAAAFIMVAVTGIPYVTIMRSGVIPGALFALAVLAAVHFRACRKNLTGLPRSELPNLWSIIKAGAHLSLPVIVLFYLLISGRSIINSVYTSIVLLLIVILLRKSTRMGPKKFLKSLEEGARKTAPLAAASACAGIIVGVVALTGLGLRFTSIIITYSGGISVYALIFTMMAAIILGMGLPTSASYIMLSALAVPALIKVGVAELPAHFFAFYFGCLSAITPPVAIAAYTGATIAGGNHMRTGFIAIRIALGVFIVPYLFVYNNALLMIGQPLDIIFSVISVSLGLVALASIFEGYLLKKNGISDTVLLTLAVFTLFPPNWISNLVGMGLVGGVILRQLYQHSYLQRD